MTSLRYDSYFWYCCYCISLVLLLISPVPLPPPPSQDKTSQFIEILSKGYRMNLLKNVNLLKENPYKFTETHFDKVFGDLLESQQVLAFKPFPKRSPRFDLPSSSLLYCHHHQHHLAYPRHHHLYKSFCHTPRYSV